MVHCTLPPRRVSRAVAHTTVEELWYVVAGRGEVWREREGRAEVADLEPGVALGIAAGTRFQFRNPGDEPLVIIIATMPPWPGSGEAVRVADHWPAD